MKRAAFVLCVALLAAPVLAQSSQASARLRQSAEWQPLRRSAGDSLGERPAHVQRINGINCLLSGHFASEAEAHTAMARLKARRVAAVLNRLSTDANIGPVG